MIRNRAGPIGNLREDRVNIRADEPWQIFDGPMEREHLAKARP